MFNYIHFQHPIIKYLIYSIYPKENGSKNIHIKEVPFSFEVSDVKLKEINY